MLRSSDSKSCIDFLERREKKSREDISSIRSELPKMGENTSDTFSDMISLLLPILDISASILPQIHTSSISSNRSAEPFHEADHQRNELQPFVSQSLSSIHSGGPHSRVFFLVRGAMLGSHLPFSMHTSRDTSDSKMRREHGMQKVSINSSQVSFSMNGIGQEPKSEAMMQNICFHPKSIHSMIDSERNDMSDGITGMIDILLRCQTYEP